MPDSKTRRSRAYHHGDLRRSLIEGALAIVRAEGVGALTMRSVARKARVSHMAPYHHFADKSALVAAVAEEGFRALRSAMTERGNQQDPRGRFREAGVAYVTFAVREPHLFRVMFGPELADKTAHPELQAAASDAFAALTGLAERARSAKRVRESRAGEVELAAWSLVHGLAMLCIDGQFGPEARDPKRAEELAYSATRTLYVGLRR